MKTYKVFLSKGGTKIIKGELQVYENQVIIIDQQGCKHAYRNYNNIEPIEDKKEVDSFEDLP